MLNVQEVQSYCHNCMRISNARLGLQINYTNHSVCVDCDYSFSDKGNCSIKENTYIYIYNFILCVPVVFYCLAIIIL